MSRQPLVSCVINFLNREKFLAEAIESVLAQNYHNWELLLVDDGSTDKSTMIAQQYARQYPDRIHYFEHENHQNRGTSTSRNLGIMHAKGKYIAFLDSDDVWLPHKLEKQIPILESHPAAGMIYGSLYWWFSWTGKPEDIERDYESEIWNFPDNTLIESLPFLHLFIQKKILIPSTTCLIVRREIAVKVGGFEDDFRNGFYDDQIFVVKMSLASPIILLKGYFEKWRRHEDSITFISENITGEGERKRKFYLNRVKKLLLVLGVRDFKLRMVLKKELFIYQSPLVFYFYKRIIKLKDQIKNRLRFT